MKKYVITYDIGTTGNQNFLRPEFWKPLIDHVCGTVVECNTAYEGTRNSTEKHIKTMEEHGWSTNFNVDIMDADQPDMVLPIPNGQKITSMSELSNVLQRLSNKQNISLEGQRLTKDGYKKIHYQTGLSVLE